MSGCNAATGSELFGVGRVAPGRSLAPPRIRTGEHPWDEAHRLLRDPVLFEFADGPVYAEPDLVQEFPHEQLTDREPESFSAPPCAERPPDPYWPTGAPAIGWHLDGDHSGLKAARDRVGDPAGRRIRIGLLDTGYDPGHETLPLHLRIDLARNFAGGDPNDATDPGRHFPWNQPGHGTATAALLAGRRVSVPSSGFNDFLGGAPYADVVPIRIADSVVHFRTSSMAAGIDYAVDVGVRGRLDQHGRHPVARVGHGGQPRLRGGRRDLRRRRQPVWSVAAHIDRLPGAVWPRGRGVRRHGGWIAVLPQRLPPAHARVLWAGVEDAHGDWPRIPRIRPGRSWAALAWSGTAAGRPPRRRRPRQPRRFGCSPRRSRRARSRGARWRRSAGRSSPLRARTCPRASGTSVKESCGRGPLLDVPFPADLAKTPADSVSFPWLRAIGVLEALPPEPAGPELMYEVEALQVYLQSPYLQELVGGADPHADSLSKADFRKLVLATARIARDFPCTPRTPDRDPPPACASTRSPAGMRRRRNSLWRGPPCTVPRRSNA